MNCTGGRVGSGADLDGCGKFVSTGIRCPDSPACGESPYRLSYPGPQYKNYTKRILLIFCVSHSAYFYSQYTGRFIMFSVITNIYNKKTKGPTLMELFTATGKVKKKLTTRDVRCVHHGWHGTHRYGIHVVATHASRVNMLTRVWQELEYRIDVCRVTRGAHIEHL